MSWVDTESNRANRNLLIVNVILGLAAGAGCVDIVSDIVSDWNFAAPFGVWVEALVLGAIFGFAGWNCLKAINRYRNIESAPIWRRLAVYGQPQQLSAEIDQDLLAPAVKYKSMKLTPHWMIMRQFFSSYVSPISDVAWVYALVTRHRTNGIPTGKSYSAVILGRHKQRFNVRASRKKVDALIAEIGQRAPWAIFGFSEELRTAWNKNHPGFLAAVDERRRKLGLK
jgi:uncharacterized protein DUF6709